MLKPRTVLRWSFTGRLALATAIFIAALFRWTGADVRDTLLATLAFVGAFAVTGASVWFESRSPTRVGPSYRYLQSLIDVALVTVIVHITGGAQSPFVALYILVTAGAILLLPVRAALLLAALGSVAYFADVALFHPEQTHDTTVVLQIAVFAVVALSTAYLGSRLREGAESVEELEQRLAWARLQAEDILRNVRSGIITVDVQGRLLYANPAAGHMLGFEVGEVLGRSAATIIGATAPALCRALERAVAEKERVTRGEADVTIDGHRIAIGLTTTTMDDGTPGGRSATAIFQDISDIKRLEELRLRAERLEGVAELSASLAHEIKNPLASIRSAVEQLGRAPRATDDERSLSTLIVRESDRLSRLLSEFLDFARTTVSHLGVVDLGEIARGAAELASAHPSAPAGVRVAYRVTGESLLVEGDEDLLHRAVFNLALNAVQAAPASGHVTIEVDTVPASRVPAGAPFASDAVALCISDDGPGIQDELRERIFDPFFTTKPGGTGLGLPIAYRAIEAHRGVLFVDSSARGTSFTMLLPRSQPKTSDDDLVTMSALHDAYRLPVIAGVREVA